MEQVAEYKFKYAKLSENPTILEINAEIERLTALKNDAKNDDSAWKINNNSVYGVVGFEGYFGYNKLVAQTVTKESELLIKYTISITNEYFRNFHNNGKVIDALKCKKVVVDYDVVNYADTDSIFPVLNDLYIKSEYDGDFVSFLLHLYKVDFKEYLEGKFRDWITEKSGIYRKPIPEDSLVIELELINHAVIWLAKKKYIRTWSYKEGVRFDFLDKIEIKGIEVAQSSTPKWVREKLTELIKYIMANGKNLNLSKLGDELVAIKSEFNTIDYNNTCKILKITDYETFVINDVDNIVIGKDCDPHIRGAAYYNYLVRKHKLENRYGLIKSNDKVQFFYTKDDPILDAFSFPVGEPFDPRFTPKINKNLQFEKLILNPINNIIESLNLKPITSNLIIDPTFIW